MDIDSLISRMGCYQYWGFEMIFIVLNKLKKKPTKEMISETNRVTQAIAEKGVKIIDFY